MGGQEHMGGEKLGEQPASSCLLAAHSPLVFMSKGTLFRG